MVIIFIFIYNERVYYVPSILIIPLDFSKFSPFVPIPLNISLKKSIFFFVSVALLLIDLLSWVFSPFMENH